MVVVVHVFVVVDVNAASARTDVPSSVVPRLVSGRDVLLVSVPRIIGAPCISGVTVVHGWRSRVCRVGVGSVVRCS